MSPHTSRPHFEATWRLAYLLRRAKLVPGIEANLILVDEAAGQMALVREPDVYVLREKPEANSLYQTAANMLLVVEVLSPGSGHVDWVEKMAEYADAGIPHYWIIDINTLPDASVPVKLHTFSLEDGYFTELAQTNVGSVEVQFNLRALLEDEDVD